MKEFWIFQTGEPLHSDDETYRGMRAINLANQLIKNNYKVKIFSSDFFHQQKLHRFNKYKVLEVSQFLEIHFIPSPGYTGNMSLKRLFDHFVLALSLKKVLNNMKTTPDAAFVGYPPIEFAFIASSWLSRKSIPFIIDVKDKWPHIFIRGIPKFFQSIGFILLFPYFIYGKSAIHKATLISANSKSFLEWAKKFGNQENSKISFIAPLAPIRKFLKSDPSDLSTEWWDRNFNIRKDDEIINIVFIGSLSKGFNFKPVAKAAKLSEVNKSNLRFIICGSGEETSNVQRLFYGLNNTIFPGWVDEKKLQAISKISHLSIAPYLSLEDFKISLPNKIYDYLFFSLPILTSLEGETKNFIKKNNIGVFYNENDNLYHKILNISNNKVKYNIMKKNCIKVSKNFSGDKVYQEIVEKLDYISDNY